MCLACGGDKAGGGAMLRLLDQRGTWRTFRGCDNWRPACASAGHASVFVRMSNGAPIHRTHEYVHLGLIQSYRVSEVRSVHQDMSFVFTNVSGRNKP